jgi:hypothetical protein
MFFTVCTELSICFLAYNLVDLISHILQIEHVVATLAQNDHYVYYSGIALIPKCGPSKLTIGQILLHYINRDRFD